jgi:D-alanyl-D-alanine carboxypeptidase (penicillin-binding protein 5/6)
LNHGRILWYGALSGLGNGFLKRLLAIFVSFLLLGLTTAVQAQSFETKAKQAFMIDAETGTVLFEKEADALIPPASLAKLMTMEVVFHAIKSGARSLEDTFTISENAWRTGGASSGGSTMFAKLDSVIRLEDLIRGVVIQSANDASIAIAEGFAGTEASFADVMTQRAREIGLTKSVFKTSTGLPNPEQKVTVRELAMLAKHIWKNYPEFYKYYSEREFTWNKITQRNRNPLLAMDIGADGMKTGFTEESGYAIVGSVDRGGRRVFLAMSGLESDRARAEEARKMLDWGATAFSSLPLYKEGESVGAASVYGGTASGVNVGAKGPVSILIPTVNKDRLKARVVYSGPVVAPIEKGQEIGVLRVYTGDAVTQETPVFALEDVPVGTLWDRATGALTELATGWIRKL